jgi:hypothetical protein
MKELPLSRGRAAIVDADDYERCARFKWTLPTTDGISYAVRTFWADGRSRTVPLHRFILGAPEGVMVHHTDADGLNNRRANLRLCTNNQNQAASRDRGRAKSPFRGVYREGWLWEAVVYHQGKRICGGAYLWPERAALARDLLARKLHGDFAQPDFPAGELPENEEMSLVPPFRSPLALRRRLG